MIYPIVIYGNPTLRKASVNIDASYPDFKKLVDDMWLTLGEASGVGLAAPQIGKNIRLFIVDCTPWAEENPELADFRKVFVNAEIYERSEEVSHFEEHDEEFSGYPARVIQHEYDHLEGKVFTDHLSPLRRNLLKSKVLKLAKGQYRCNYKTK